jgi:AMMECR1 domain-containing protein
MSSTEMLSKPDRAALLDVARASIRHGLRHGQALEVDPGDYPETLRPPRATFVTLEIGGQLRGCIGALVAYQAAGAGCRRARLSPPPSKTRVSRNCGRNEFPKLDIHISVLSPPEPLHSVPRTSCWRNCGRAWTG